MCPSRNSIFVPLMEQQFSFASLARQCKSEKTGADGAILELSNFEPGGPLVICRRPFQCAGSGATMIGGSACKLYGETAFGRSLVSVQCAPFNVHEVEQVVVLPRSHLIHAATH